MRNQFGCVISLGVRHLRCHISVMMKGDLVMMTCLKTNLDAESPLTDKVVNKMCMYTPTFIDCILVEVNNALSDFPTISSGHKKILNSWEPGEKCQQGQTHDIFLLLWGLCSLLRSTYTVWPLTITPLLKAHACLQRIL